MQEHNMVILSEAYLLGTCRDLTRVISNGDKGKVRTTSKDLDKTVVFRCDGQPIWNAALTPFKGSNTVSPFIVLS